MISSREGISFSQYFKDKKRRPLQENIFFELYKWSDKISIKREGKSLLSRKELLRVIRNRAIALVNKKSSNQSIDVRAILRPDENKTRVCGTQKNDQSKGKKSTTQEKSRGWPMLQPRSLRNGGFLNRSFKRVLAIEHSFPIF